MLDMSVQLGTDVKQDPLPHPRHEHGEYILESPLQNEKADNEADVESEAV